MKPFALIILDGLANNPNPKGNAVAAARKPNLDRIFSSCPYTELVTFGERVGLPDDQMGNSEVGHLNIGAGRIVEQDLLRINRAVREKRLHETKAFQGAVQAAFGNETALHLVGLCSRGGVHSSLEHLIGLLDELATNAVKRVFLHVITDGRDRPPNASLEELKELEEKIAQLRAAHPEQEIAIVDVIGRYFAMDRDQRWDRTEKAYNLFTAGAGELYPSLAAAINGRIASGETDEFYSPCRIELPAGYRNGAIQNGDAVICFNFRADRMRQLCSAFLGELSGFIPKKVVTLERLVTLTQYDANFPVENLFPPIKIQKHFGEIVSQAGLTQVRIAETEKYPHVTYFFNGGVEEKCAGEERVLIPSPRDVPTYDKKPEMSAYGVTEAIIQKLSEGKTNIFIINFANCDMVGHTGVLEAGVKAVETVDKCLGVILAKLEELGGSAMITADHGNADQMIDYETGGPHTFHTKYPVPLVITGPLGSGKQLRTGGALCDIAPTACELLGLSKPADMTGTSLIKK